VPEVRVEYADVASYVREAIATVERTETPEVLEDHGVDVVLGGAELLTPRRIRVGEREIEADKIILAMGSRARWPSVRGLAEVGAIDHVGLFELTRLPRRLVVLGGGPIGMEMGQAFARLGAEVTVLQRGPRILPRDDEELAALLQDYVSRELRLICNAAVREVRASSGSNVVVFEAGGREETLECDQILVATGRKPNLEGLGLEEVGVELDDRGVVVDSKLRTSVPNIWACGDCVGPLHFTHFAEAQARTAVRNALFLGSEKFDGHQTPWVTFTDPEFAHVGATEAQARTAHAEIEVLRFPYEKLDRAICDGEDRGLAKTVLTPKGRILGASILGPHAGEAITEIVIAMKTGIAIQDLSSFVHPYPVLNRIVRRLGDERFMARGVGGLTRKLFGQYRGPEPRP
jgi:pyruvate/2-oxoglutarate dehydrogenase complex dihydrolipoamide dehydrogenase (E3) component